MLDWKINIAPDKYFYCRDGIVFKNIDDMINSLGDKNKQQEDGMLRFHINNNNNDFANWIIGVFALNELGEKIRQIKEPEAMITAINEYKKEHASEIVQSTDEENKTEIKEETEETKKKIDPKEKARLESLMSEEERLKKNIADLTEESDFLFDKVKRMRMKSYMNKKSMKDKISEIYQDYDDLNAKISEWRRKGYDLFIPALKIKNLKPKIKFLEVSESKEDYEKVTNLIQEILKDIKEASEKEPLDIKSEIMEAAGLAKPKVEE